jgi:hypothetical protein
MGASLATVGLAPIPIQVAHADSMTQVPCAVQALVNAIGHTSSGDVLSLAQGCVYVLTNPIQDANLGPNGLPVITQKLTINGNGATITRAQSAPSFRIFAVKGDLTLNDVTLTNGAAAGDNVMDNFRPGEGGAVLNLGILRVNRSTLSHNQAKFFGGGIGNGDGAKTATSVGGDVALNDSVISDSTAGADGGAIGNGIKGTVRLIGCAISGNKGDPSLAGSTFGGVAAGGGIASQGTVFVTRCLIVGNTANNGGGIINAGKMFVIDSLLSGNSVTPSSMDSGFGGGLLNLNDATVTLAHTDVTGNRAINGGGGIVNTVVNGVVGTAMLTDSDVTGNSTTMVGGGILNGGNMNLTHSNVTGNDATGDGGGIYNFTEPKSGARPLANLTLTHSDVTNNNAGQGHQGGGIFNQTDNKVRVKQTTVVFNTPDDCTGVDPSACSSMSSAVSTSSDISLIRKPREDRYVGF